MHKLKLALAIISAIDEILVEPLRDGAAAVSLSSLRETVSATWPSLSEPALRSTLSEICALEVA